jgi:putative peptidoglycan lipid II flippase
VAEPVEPVMEPGLDPEIWAISGTVPAVVVAPPPPVAPAPPAPPAPPKPGSAAAAAGAPAVEEAEAELSIGEAPSTGAVAALPGGKGLLRANLLVASGTAVSRLTGLVRTSLIIVLLGKGLNDAYVNANNTPNMIYELILGGVLTASLVPLFTDDLEHGDGRDGTSAIISFAVVALLVVTLLGLLAGPGIILLLSTGSAASTRHDYVRAGVPLALLFAPQIFFYGLMAVWSAVLNARHRFLAAAWAPVLNNLIAIATLLGAASLVDGDPTLADALADHRILWVLGLGTTFGIAVMAMALYPTVRKAGVRVRFRPQLRHPAVQKAIRLSGWTFGYVIANQIALIVIQILAKPSSGDPTRYQTAFQYFQLPHALLAVSIMVTFEPLLGRADARGDRKAFNDQLLLGFRLIGLLVIPAAVGYIALPKGLDSRTFVATGQVAKALGLGGIIAGFAVGLPGFSTYLYALRGFYAMKDTRTPFRINCLENAINIAAAIVFVRWWGVVGLALAFALAYTVAAAVAVAVLGRHSPGFDWRALVRTWGLLLVAAMVMGGFVYGVVWLVSPGSSLMLLPALGAGVVVGALTYFTAIYALAVPGIAELMARLPVLRRFA